MPRNEAKPLDILSTRAQDKAVTRLSALKADDATVTLTYVKRSGQPSTSTGTIGEFSGKPGYDTGSVTLHTDDKGPRTINLHRITGYTIVK